MSSKREQKRSSTKVASTKQNGVEVVSIAGRPREAARATRDADRQDVPPARQGRHRDFRVALGYNLGFHFVPIANCQRLKRSLV